MQPTTLYRVKLSAAAIATGAAHVLLVATWSTWVERLAALL